VQQLDTAHQNDKVAPPIREWGLSLIETDHSTQVLTDARMHQTGGAESNVAK
jgi:hypothetical protein